MSFNENKGKPINQVAIDFYCKTILFNIYGGGWVGVLAIDIFIKIGTSKVAAYVKGNILDQLH